MISHMKNSPTILTFPRIKQVACLFITLLTLSACSEDVSDKTSNSKVAHQSASTMVISPEQRYSISRDYLGQVTAKQQSNLSFEYSGKISNILVDSGDVVKKGQRLAQLDTQLLSYKTAELQAQITQSKAQISLNKTNLNRIKILITDGYSSKQRLDELNAENTILKAQINGLTARIKTLTYQREQSALVAPFDGVITKRFIAHAEVITASTPSFRIIQSANNEINVGIPSKVASTLTLAQRVQVKINNQNKQAQIIAIGHQIDVVNRTVQLRLKMLEPLDNSKNFNGQLVRVTIAQQVNKPGFWLPISAITDGVRGQWQIFIATPLTNSKNNYLLQSATVNVLQANEHSVYISGLTLKQHSIIAQGVHRYVAGQVVSVSTPILSSTVGNH